MNQRTPRRSLPAGWSWNDILRDLVATWRLLWDPSVPSLLKLFLPALTLVYLLSPLDLIPFMPFDDIAVALIAARLFVALSPRESVDRAFGGGSPASSATPNARRSDEGDAIDTTWRVLDD